MSDQDYRRFLVDNPRPAGNPTTVKNIIPPFQLMNETLVPEARYNIEMAWITGIPDPDPHTIIHTHNYNEVILFIGGDCGDPENLFAEVEFNLGNRKLDINSTGAIFVPAGVPHGQSRWKSVSKPHVKITVGIGAGTYQAQIADPSLARADRDYALYQVKKPAYEVLAGTPVKGRQGPSSMTFMNNNLVPHSDIYIEGGWVWGMPDPNPHIFEHVHNYEEIVIHFGSDFRQPVDLGGEIEFGVGGQPLTINKTSAVFVPSGVSHGPLTWKQYRYPHLEMAIMPGAGTLDEADPGGHREKTRRETVNGQS